MWLLIAIVAHAPTFNYCHKSLIYNVPARGIEPQPTLSAKELLEFFRPRHVEPFEHRHFGVDHTDARIAHTACRNLYAFGMTGAGRIGDHKDIKIQVSETEDALHNAHVGLDTADHQLGSAVIGHGFDPVSNGQIGRTGKMRLFHHRRIALDVVKSRDRGAKPLSVLLGKPSWGCLGAAPTA